MLHQIEVKFKLHKKKYVVCRLKLAKTHDEFHTGHTAENVNWREGFVKGRSTADHLLKSELQKLRKELEQIKILEGYTATTVKKLYLGEYLTTAEHLSILPTTILRAISYHNKVKKKTKQHTQNSVDYYLKFQNSFTKFLESIGLPDIRLTELTKELIRSYNQWLTDTGVKSEYSRYQYCTAVSTCIDFVIKEFSDKPEMIKYNPVKGTIKRPSKTKLKALSRANHLPYEYEDIIRELAMSGFTRNYTHEWWKWTALFQINSGYSFTDLGSDHWQIVKTLDGDVIEFFRVKSYEPSIIPILPNLKKCIEKLRYYQKEYEAPRMFPIRKFVSDNNIDEDMSIYDSDYQQYLTFLKLLEKEIKSPVPISTHTLRHTFGMIMTNVHLFPSDDVALMMGHSDPRTTRDNYVAVNRARILKQTKKLLG